MSILSDDNFFTGVLNSVSAIVKNDDVYLKLAINHKENSDHQNFLNSYQDKLQRDNIRTLFISPIQWENITIKTDADFDVTFDAVRFKAKLVSIKVSKKETKEETYYNYSLIFEKQQDRDVDIVLSSLLKQKEEDEDGKKRLIEFDVALEIDPDGNMQKFIKPVE